MTKSSILNIKHSPSTIFADLKIDPPALERGARGPHGSETDRITDEVLPADNKRHSACPDGVWRPDGRPRKTYRNLNKYRI